MLRQIELTNFKCFEHLDMACTALNLLCGLNGMGKSSVIQALLVLRQSFQSGELHQGKLVLEGDRIDLGLGLDVLFEGAETDVIGFALQDDRAMDVWKLDFNYSQTSDESNIHILPSPLGKEDKDSSRDMSAMFQGWQGIPPFEGRMVYIPAERPGPQKWYPTSEILARYGEFGVGSEFAWNYLNSHQDDVLDNDDPRCLGTERRLLEIVAQWLQSLCPGIHLQLEAIQAADAIVAGFQYDQPGDIPTRWFRATNAGFGLSYVVPVILALLSPPGTLCLLENPEAYLYPRGQTRMGELAARASLAGVQVFAETHSEHFMDGVRIAVREGLLRPEDALFHYFEREGIRVQVSSLQVDSGGRLSRWPEGFFDQADENLARLLAPRP